MAGGRAHVNFAQKLRILPELRRRLHHHVVLVQRGVHGRDLPLAKRVVQCIVIELRRDVESCGGLPVVSDHRLQTLILQIGVHVRNRVVRFQRRQESRTANAVREGRDAERRFVIPKTWVSEVLAGSREVPGVAAARVWRSLLLSCSRVPTPRGSRCKWVAIHRVVVPVAQG